MNLKFEWDTVKAASNLRKHGVSFEEASTVFSNPLAKIFLDKEHSISEDREFIIGDSILGRLLIVYYTERDEGLIRIIGARKTTRRERNDYEENP